MKYAAALSLAALLFGRTPGVAQFPTPEAADPLGAVAGAPLGTLARPPVGDPFPLRRVLATADRLPALLKTLPPGPVAKLDREAFEALARAATARPVASPANLVEARYAATHSADGLRGTLAWKFAAGNADFALDAVGVALSIPAADAVVRFVALPARPATLVVPGDGTASLGWSASGRADGDAERFTLVLPAAPLSVLDLDLPADREPTLAPGSAGRTISGPLPGATPGRQRRQILFPGQGRVEFSLRPITASIERDAPVRVARVARYEFTPGVVNFAVECGLEAVRGAPEELVFLVDPRCQITAVTAPGRISWAVDDTTPGRPRLRVPCPGGLPAKVTVTGFLGLPLTAETGWPLPDLRLVGGLAGGDAVEVTCRPDVQWLGCDPGDYRSAALPALPPTAEEGVRFGFQAVPRDAQPTPDAARRLPTVRVRSLGATYSTVDEITWEAGTPVEEPRLTARFRVAVVRGPLETLTLQLGPGYRIVSAEQVNENAPLTVSGRRVELTRPARAGESVEVVVRLVGPRPRPGEAVPFPRAACQDAAGREGTYTVLAPPGYDATASAAPAVTLANPTRLRYPLRGHAPNAAVTLTPHAARVSGTSDTAVSVVDGVPTRVTVFRLAATGGPLGQVRVRVPKSPGSCVKPEGFGARVAPAFPVEPWASVLGASSPWAVSAGVAAAYDTAESVQCVTFAPAEATQAVVRVTTTADAAGNFPVALPTVIGARIVPAVPVEFLAAETGAVGWRYRGLVLTASVDSCGRLAGTVSGVLISGASSEWRVGLPAGATVQSASVNGKSADIVRLDGGAIVLPPQRVVAGTSLPVEMPFEVRFQLPESVPVFGGMVEAPEVELPGDPTVPTAWVLAPEYRCWPRLDAMPDPTPHDGPLTVVPTALPVATGWVLAALVLGGAFVLASRRRLSGGWFVALAVCGLAGAGLLPPGWSLALRPVVLATFLLATVGLVARARPRGLGLALALGVGGVAGASKTADPQTVLVVAGPGDRWTVYAARSTLDAFAELARPTPPAIVLTGVEYAGRGTASGSSHFKATMTLVAAGDGEETYEVPLGGVRLDSLDLDGKPALPEATRLDAYTIRVRGRGPHTVTAEFRVPTVTTDGGRETRFTGSDFPTTRLSFHSPAATVDVVSRRGAQSVEQRGGETVVSADHGGGRAVVVRTRDATPPTPAVASVREGHLWDIGSADATLSSAFQWSVSSGSLASVAVEIPAGLEPGTPVLRADGPRPGVAPEVRSAVVSPSEAGRKLVAEFAAPVTGRFTMLVKFTPRAALVARPVLALPRALTPVAIDALVGLRVRGLALDAVDKRGVIDYPADELTRRFGAIPEWQLDRAPADRVFQRLTGPTGELQPTVRPKLDAGVVACETRWTLGPAVEVDAQVAVTKFAPTDSVEFDWPDGASLKEVRSPELHGWSKVGSRVQVWFRKPTRQAVVSLAGTSSTAPAGAGATLDLGAVRAAGVPAASVLRVRPAAGLEARWVPSKGAAVRADSTPAETLLTLDPGVPAGRVQLLPVVAESPRPKPPVPAVAPLPSAPPVTPPAEVTENVPADDSAAVRGWLIAVSWPLALVVVAVARRRGLPAPECLAACGLLGWGVAGPTTFLGLLFLGAGIVGVLWRLTGVAARASRLVLR